MEKTGIITGASGGIGGAFAKYFLEKNYKIYAPVRDTLRVSKNIAGHQLLRSFKADITSKKAMCEALKKTKSIPTVVVLSAGTFAWDTEFPNQAKAIKQLTAINTTSKKTFVTALVKTYGKKLDETTLIMMGSHARTFLKSDPRRKNEEGYVQSMLGLYYFGKELRKKKIFKEVIVFEPGLIDTPLARKKFTKETIGETPNWKEVPTPRQYVLHAMRTIDN